MLCESNARRTRTFLWFGHGCSANRMPGEHGRYYGLGMDALVTVCSRNTDVTIYGLGMAALVTACSGSMNAKMAAQHLRSQGFDVPTWASLLGRDEAAAAPRSLWEGGLARARARDAFRRCAGGGRAPHRDRRKLPSSLAGPPSRG